MHVKLFLGLFSLKVWHSLFFFVLFNLFIYLTMMMNSPLSLTYLSQTDMHQSVLVLNVDGSDALAPVSLCLMFMGRVLSLNRTPLSFF